MLAFVAVGRAWPNHLAMHAMRTTVASLSCLTTEVVSLGGIGTDTGCA